MIFHIFKDILIILWCLYIDQFNKLNIVTYKHYFDRSRHLSWYALTIGERYKLHNLTIMGNRICKQYHLPRIHIWIVSHGAYYVSTTRIVKFHNVPYNIIIDRKMLDSVSFDCLLASIYHEIGHYFAPKIILKHHLCKCFFVVLQYKPTIAFRLSVFGLIVTFIPYGWIISIILMIYLMINLGLGHSKKHQKYYKNFCKWCEIVADEFAVSINHNAYLMIEALRQTMYVAVGPRQVVPFIERTTFQDPQSEQYFEAKSIEYTRRYLNYIYNLLFISGSVHPSITIRAKHIRKFAKNGYRW